MKRTINVNLGNLILSLSDAMDLASPSLAQHQQRTAFIVFEIGKLMNLSSERLKNNFIAALLHDVGAFSLEEKISLRNYEVENIEAHCIRGEILLAQLQWLKEVAKIVRFHHKKWENWEVSIGSHLALETQLLFLADHLERLIDRKKYILHQREDIIANIKSLSGSSFHPQVVELFLSVSNREEFWLDLVSQRLYSILLNEGPLRDIEKDLSTICSFAELFRNIIDFRSRFTATHSSGVAAAASLLSRIFGLTDTEIGLIEVAGNLHDVGKLSIPNSILDKPGKLAKEEMAVMKRHSYYTYSVLNTIGGLRQISEWAAYHHEKLDGSGYPFHCKANELDTGARIIMVADIFTALAEDRSYRKGMSKEGTYQIMKQFSNLKLIADNITDLLFDNYEEIYSHVIEKQRIAQGFYENQFS